MRKFVAGMLMVVGVPLLEAGEVKTITLKDHSVLQGEVTESAEGSYTLKSPLLGEITIPKSQVLSITGAGSVPSPTPAPGGVMLPATLVSDSPTVQSAIQSSVTSRVQGWLAQNGGMDALMSFSKNPDLAAVVNDPKLMQAIQSGDFTSLMQSESVKKLMENPQTKALVQGILGNTAKPPTPSPTPR